MKTSLRLALLLSIYAIPGIGTAQTTMTFDTTVTGIGGSDNTYNLTFPKFDPTVGTLTDVKVITVLTMSIQYEIENNLAGAQNHKVRFHRSDEISSSALDETIYADYDRPKAPLWLNHNLAASNGVTGSGPDFMSVAPFNLINKDTVINQSIANAANFLGTGEVSLDYASSMSRLSNPASGANITDPIAQDQIKFMVQYVYISNIVLATDITGFSANKKDQSVDLRWFTQNETADRHYELQKSTDGKNFSTIKNLSSSMTGNQTASYLYSYLPANETGTIIFRVKQIERNGTVKYSAVRVVDLGKVEQKSGIRLMPNPTNGEVTVILNNSNRSDWNIELFNLKGQVIEKKQVSAGAILKLNASRKLSPGIYFVMASNKKSGEKSVERLIVH